ncbi:L-lactate permease [Streptomyces iranensis]|uniref:L-lactate permease n=1 Tax=Streptomyces iranensis TaxID=576784 RepID=A0A060ZGL6_9ACTN|nr:L-lactate permease [Streptomyces iranensis]MBP2066559.1 lactate permease [Streptomyces iranensis]CDR05098.1 L-lactate permease [Streptomyces iranensis]
MYHQPTAPLGGSLGWSALTAAIPLLLLFLLLGVFRVRAWIASVIGLLVATAVAIGVYGMPFATAVSGVAEGAVFGLFPVMWIVANAIWVYRMTRDSGDFDRLREAFSRVSDDRRIQGLIIAFSFGALLEALAGFGAPVAICSVMLVALGLSAMRAVTVSMIANTVPVAWGGVGLPIITLGQVTGIPVDTLSEATAHLVPVLALFVPMLLLVVLDGARGVREVWPAAAVAGVAFAVPQYAVATFGPIQLVDIVAALASAGSVLLLTRFWQPRRSEDSVRADVEAPGGGALTPTGTGATGVLTAPSRVDVFRAFAPYLVIIVLFTLSVIPSVKGALKASTLTFEWPGLEVRTPEGEPVALATYKFDWLATPGTVLLIAGVVIAMMLRISARSALRAYGQTLSQLREAAGTVMAVLALAYVMNLSGQTTTLGLFLATAGSFFVVLSPLLGWFGTAVTGSDTSSNSLFGALQVSAAQGTGMSPTLAAAANTAGGVLGKMMSPQNLAIGAAAVGLAGREGEILRRVLLASAVLVPALCLLVYLQSTPVLGWLVP